MQNEEKKVNKSFAQNTKSELKKVIWPTGKQTMKSTAVTIGFVLLISVILVVLNIAFAVIFVVLFVLSLALNNVILSLCSAVAFILTFMFFSTYLSKTKRVNFYNAVLDLYDNLKSFNLPSKNKLNLSIALEKFAVAFLNNESNSHVELLLFEMLEYLVESEDALAFIKSNKTFKKYV